MGETPNKYDALTGLRFLAALSIFAWHLPGVLWLETGAFDNWNLAQGVSFFFVLSGFVLQHAYRTQIETIGASRFFLMRFARLWPAHIAVIVLICLQPWAFRWFMNNLEVKDALSVIFLTQSWHTTGAPVYSINAVSWSISTELAFYLLFPFLTGPLRRNWPLWLVIVGIASMFWLNTAKNIDYIHTNPVVRAFEFALGMAGYEVLKKRRVIAGTIAEVVVIFAVVSAVYFTTMASDLISDPAMKRYISAAGSAIIFVVMICVFSEQKGLFSKWLSTGPLVWLGNVSFAFYLIHQPVIRFFGRVESDLHPAALVGAAFLVSVAIAGIIYHLVETPSRSIAYKAIRSWPRRTGTET